MPQCSGIHILTRLVQHATLSVSGPIRIPETAPGHLVACQKYVIILPMIRLEEHVQMMYHAWIRL